MLKMYRIEPVEGKCACCGKKGKFTWLLLEEMYHHHYVVSSLPLPKEPVYCDACAKAFLEETAQSEVDRQRTNRKQYNKAGYGGLKNDAGRNPDRW